jgi:formylglycine-generating enzyme required for sulfatase activity
MARRARESESNLAFLASQYGEERWREVIRLFLAMATRADFEAFMDEVVAAGRLAGRHDLTSRCLREAAQPGEAPFVTALRDPKQRYEALQALHVLRDLIPEPLRRVGEDLGTRAEQLFKAPATDLKPAERELAARLLPEVPAPAPGDGAPLVFLSYSRRDATTVKRVAAGLEAAGVRIWLDVGEIRAGEVLARRVEEGVSACTYFVPVLSPHSLRSGWTQLETDLAWQREIEEGRIVIVPALLAGESRALPLRYRARRWVDLRKDLDAGVAELVALVRGRPALATVRINPVDGTELVLIPAGGFQAGDRGEPSDPLQAFYLARYPVTNAQYARFLAANPKARRSELMDDERFKDPQQPVVDVSLAEAETYCRWAGLRLPTEWEWEKGARGTDGWRYPWGDPDPTARRANFGMHVGHPTPVGSYPEGASPYGLHDMAGNVWEWTTSLYAQTKGRLEREGWRTVRGGSFGGGAQDLRAACRVSAHPEGRGSGVGFRCAQDP